MSTRRSGSPARTSSALGGYAVAVGFVLAAIAIGFAFRRVPYGTLSLLFLVAVVLTAVRSGLWPSVFASVLSFVALNFLFTPPLYTLAIEAEGDLATLVFFVLVAALTGNLAARMRAEMASNRAALDRVSTLLDFSRRMAGATTADEALATLVRVLGQVFRSRAVALLPDAGGRLVERASHGDARAGVPDAAELQAAWAERRTLRTAPGWTFFVLATAEGPVGMAAVAVEEVAHERRVLADGLCEQASTTLARTLLVDNLRQAQLSSEAERLRSALLASVSHDLRTPLASIIGATTSVLQYADTLDAESRRDLLQTALGEAQRLDRYIQNLLDVTRFGQSDFVPQRAWVDLRDLASSAVSRLGSALAGFDVRIAIADDAALLFVHGALIEQGLVNLLDNAAGFSPPGAAIAVTARAAEDEAVIEVSDEGPGIDPDERERVFEMFYRASDADRRARPGAGLGLAICRSLVAAHGGTIRALPAEGPHGTRMQIRLPTSDNPAGPSRG